MLFYFLTAFVFILSFLFHRKGKFGRFFIVSLGLGAVSVLLCLVFKKTSFHFLALACHVLFIFLPVYLLLCAAIYKSRSSMTRNIALLVALALVIVGVDAFFIEPHRLQVERVEIVSEKISAPLKIVVLSDIQTDKIGDYEKQVIEHVNKLSPDVILYPGDYIQSFTKKEWLKQKPEFQALIKQIKVKPELSSFAVQGNVDPYDMWPDLFNNTGVYASNETFSKEVGGITVTGLSFRDGFDEELKISKADNFHIVFGHGPDFALGEIEADLLVAGHTHGGQVQIPFIGPIITLSKIPRAWASGVTELGWKKNLVVSNGIGMERNHAPRLRFLCPPQVYVITLLPENQN